jgi:hypothetical protein
VVCCVVLDVHNLLAVRWLGVGVLAVVGEHPPIWPVLGLRIVLLGGLVYQCIWPLAGVRCFRGRYRRCRAQIAQYGDVYCANRPGAAVRGAPWGVRRLRCRGVAVAPAVGAQMPRADPARGAR